MKLKFSSNKRKRTVVFIVLLVICETLVYVASTPRPTEQFLQLYVLGPSQLIADYYPDNNSNIHLGEQISWYLGVTNDMGSVQLISILAKISNQTIEPPNDTLAISSPAPAIIEFPRFIQDNQTWLTPFDWSITNATAGDGSTRIVTLQINNETYQISDWSASSGYEFRFIFELWTWQANSNEFEFGWNANGEPQAAWLQIWFNMTSLSSSP